MPLEAAVAAHARPATAGVANWTEVSDVRGQQRAFRRFAELFSTGEEADAADEILSPDLPRRTFPTRPARSKIRSPRATSSRRADVRPARPTPHTWRCAAWSNVPRDLRLAIRDTLALPGGCRSARAAPERPRRQGSGGVRCGRTPVPLPSKTSSLDLRARSSSTGGPLSIPAATPARLRHGRIAASALVGFTAGPSDLLSRMLLHAA
jgi:hypothetical protein